MKRMIALLLVLSCLLGLVACNANKHTCRPLASEQDIDWESSSLNKPFITDEEKDILLNKAVRDYLDDLDKNSLSFTYEITGTQSGVYENKETILYWVKIVYGEGFTTVMGFIIQ